jgi:hypothetical protein
MAHFVILSTDPEGDEVTAASVAHSLEGAREWVMGEADGYRDHPPITFLPGDDQAFDDALDISQERVIFDWNPAWGSHDEGFVALGTGSGPFHYRIVEVAE